jgi:hypothetical protein
MSRGDAPKDGDRRAVRQQFPDTFHTFLYLDFYSAFTSITSFNSPSIHL